MKQKKSKKLNTEYINTIWIMNKLIIRCWINENLKKERIMNTWIRNNWCERTNIGTIITVDNISALSSFQSLPILPVERWLNRVARHTVVLLTELSTVTIIPSGQPPHAHTQPRRTSPIGLWTSSRLPTSPVWLSGIEGTAAVRVFRSEVEVET